MQTRWPWHGAVAKRAAIEYLRHYHRWEIEGTLTTPTEPTLFVSHHGYGSVFDLNVSAALGVFDALAITEPVTLLAHELAWTVGVGRYLEPFGARPASHESALDSFEHGRHALVMPGGDVDGFKPHRDRNRIIFDGRIGFAELAIKSDVPIIPIVTSGAGDTLYAISDGRSIAHALKLDRYFRLKAIPTTISIPWGLNVGLVGFAPHLPLPVKITTRVLPAVRANENESAQAFADRVQATMQAALDDMTQSKHG